MRWTRDQYQRTRNLTPTLSLADLANALAKAHKTLPEDRLEPLRQQLDGALRGYIWSKLLEHGGLRPKPHLRAKHFERVAEKAGELRKLIQADVDAWNYSYGIAIGDELAFQAKGTPTRSDDTDALGYESMKVIDKALKVLETAARERLSIEKGSKQEGHDRHKGDPAMRKLIATINGLWNEVFNEKPRVTLSSEPDEGGGSYLPVVYTLLHAYATKLPDELCLMHNGLRPRLRLSQQAIRANFRATRKSMA